MTLFSPSGTPRLFAEPLGVDFSEALVAGLRTRLAGQPPEAIARVTILVNTRRMERRLREVFLATGHGFLPKLMLVSDPAALCPTNPLPNAVSPLHLRLTVSHLVGRLLAAAPDLAPRSAAFDLAGSLCDLLGEMQEERVPTSALKAIETGTLSAHWERSLTFLDIVTRYLALDGAHPELITTEARQAAALDALFARWDAHTPQDPILVAGSTGSRGPTLRLMERIASLPQGALILPGVDQTLSPTLWRSLVAQGSEDHPQFRYAALCDGVGIDPAQLPQWSTHNPNAPERTRLLSLALRPAPVTDQWRAEGPSLRPDLAAATDGMTLLEARTPRTEAITIALRLRQAIEDGTRAALISPDRVLTRQVTSALNRWGITPDDSAGAPLGLSAPGRLLRMVAQMMGRPTTPERLLALLKHPLTHSGRDDRGQHLLFTRNLELDLLRRGCPFPDRTTVTQWLTDRKTPTPETLPTWVAWLCDLLDLCAAEAPDRPLADHLRAHIALCERLCAGPDAEGAGELWEKAPGIEAASTISALRTDAGQDGPGMTLAEYGTILSTVLQGGEVREPFTGHSNVMIWGAMEARVQGADLVILAGLNDGVWPDLPTPDPWMNRKMRMDAGLRTPDRRIGLSAHDFQQAIAGKQVWLTRSLRDAEAETVPSRWLNRLTNLLRGLAPEGPDALRAMTDRAAPWTLQAEALDRPETTTPRAPRPAPAPALAARPRQLSVTRIQTLIRDPYAIYAANVLNLRALDPLRQTPDAPLRGTIIHAVMDRFTAATKDGLSADPLALFERILTDTLTEQAPWPAARRLWRAKLMRIAPQFLAREAERRTHATPALTEERGRITLPEIDFTLSAEADRIDTLPDGRVWIYDYKTGQIPSAKVQTFFDRQMPLEALIVEGGGFKSLGVRNVAGMTYIGLGSAAKDVDVNMNPVVDDMQVDLLPETRAGLIRLIRSYDSTDQGYISHRAMEDVTYESDYEHLARRGEWDDTAPATLIRVGREENAP